MLSGTATCSRLIFTLPIPDRGSAIQGAQLSFGGTIIWISRGGEHIFFFFKQDSACLKIVLAETKGVSVSILTLKKKECILEPHS